MRRAAVLAVLALAPTSCAKRPASSGSSGAPAAAATTPAPQQSASALAPPAGPWREHVRAMRWREAAVALDALPEAERARPDLRYLRARVASELGDPAAVLRLLDGATMPALAASVAGLRADAQAKVGPFEAAAQYFAAREGLSNQLRAAEAEERAGKPDDARATLTRALAVTKARAAETRLRAARMGLAERSKQGDQGLADARWISREAPGHASGEAAIALLRRLAPDAHPSSEELLARADKLAQAGKATLALADIEAARAGTNEGELTAAHGRVLYKLRRYAEAARVLGRAAKLRSSDDDAFLAARALSRANRDADAIRAYDALRREHPRSDHAEEAAYLAARLSMLLGENEDAVARYGAYLKRYRKGKHAAAAEYDRALVLLAEGRPADAVDALGALARAEDDKAERARLRELEGVAAMKAGDAARAEAAFVEVMKTQPLSFPAQAAEARLVAMGVTPPPRLGPPESGTSAPLSPTLPADAAVLHGLGLDDEAEQALRAGEKALSAAHQPRGVEALCAAYGALDHATRRYRVAQAEVKAATLLSAPSAATRWAWECLYPAPYLPTVREVEAREGLPTGLVHAIMRQESAFDVDVVSPANAVGLMQLLPATAREVSKRAGAAFEDGWLTRPGTNIDLGARYLGILQKTWQGNLPLAVASYNAGPAAVSRWLEGAKGAEIDVFVARIPYGETRTYVSRVMGNLARYRYLDGGLDAVQALPLAIDHALRAAPDAF
ncbi:MAG: transglycosylase SLT domain-containing protein [Polyangiaceae bacterium]|nr:transglycosylase SLT domain-containing protein [Polyangiaceae bacterium]